MKRLLRGVYGLLLLFGFDPLKTIRSIRGVPSYLGDFSRLRHQKNHSEEAFPFGRVYPCLGDRYAEGGSASGHYFHQDLLVARRIFLNNPDRHIDVGSRIDGFVAHVASFRPIEVLDIRPISNTIPNVTFSQADMMSPVGDDWVEVCDSLSCLHALEHFGLGRYGDPVNYDGHLLGLENLYRFLKPGGTLYFSVPIGPQRIEFNAHRVFSVAYLKSSFDRHYTIAQFSFVDDLGLLHENVPITTADVEGNYGCTYGCGIFELTKR